MQAKIEVMKIAAIMAGAVISNLPDTLTLDKDIKAEDIRAEDLMEWEVFRIFYHAIIGVLTDTTGSWPDPPAEAAGPVAGLLTNPTALQGLLSGLLTGPTAGPLVGILKGLLGALPATSSPLPNPGAPAAPAK